MNWTNNSEEMSWFANKHSTTCKQPSSVHNTAHLPFGVLPYFTWTFAHVPFGLVQPHVDDLLWFGRQSVSSRVVYGLLALELLPSVVKGNRCTCSSTYSPRHSHRVDRKPYFSTLEYFKHRGSWGLDGLE